jgi:protein-disulfide isomerase/uncharacterized membrane protein
MEANSQIKETRRNWLVLFLTVSLVGAGVSIELTSIYIKVRTDPNYESFCAINELANCDTVAVSRYSSFLGIPVSIWGLAGYAGMTAFCIWGMIRRLRPSSLWPMSLLFGLSVFSVAVSLILFGISLFIIKSFCPLCMTIYGISFILLIISFIGMREGGLRSIEDILADAFDCLRRPRLVASGLLSVLLLMSVVIAGYHVGFGQVKVELPEGPGGLPVGVDDEGNHWIGARNPKLIIQEFSDYQCPFCRKAHQQARTWLAKHADEVRLLHRHLPLDHHCNPIVTRPFHPDACKMARLAYCAGTQEKFWEMNDLLYSLPLGARVPPVEILARGLNLNKKKLASCMESRYCEKCLMRDINFCIEKGMHATPTFVMNGKMYTGKIPKSDLEHALQAARSKGD